MSEPPLLPASPAAERWAAQLAGWGIPQHILDGAPVSPWVHDVGRFTIDATLDRTRVSARWEREVLPPLGGTVLDVGCGGGRSSLPLVPPATELIGVDRTAAMLDEFVEASAAVGVARRTVHGVWPEVAPSTPVADLVVCHHVVYDVGDIAPFLWALTDHARLAVVIEMSSEHPMSAWAPAWRHFWGVERPSGPSSDDLLAVLGEMGLDPERTTSPHAARDVTDSSTLTALARRRLCLPADRDAELTAWLADHPPCWPDTLATFRWPGAAEEPV